MLLARLQRNTDAWPLASEAIVTLISQHWACRNSSRLPVLVLEAAYVAVEEKLGQRTRPMKAYSLADTLLGIEVSLVNDEGIRTVYEMKMKCVTRNDIDDALTKVARSDPRIDNYLFVTTDPIDDDVREYAVGLYEQTAARKSPSSIASVSSPLFASVPPFPGRLLECVPGARA